MRFDRENDLFFHHPLWVSVILLSCKDSNVMKIWRSLPVVEPQGLHEIAKLDPRIPHGNVASKKRSVIRNNKQDMGHQTKRR